MTHHGRTMILYKDLTELFDTKIRPILIQTESPYRNCKLS